MSTETEFVTLVSQPSDYTIETPAFTDNNTEGTQMVTDIPEQLTDEQLMQTIRARPSSWALLRQEVREEDSTPAVILDAENLPNVTGINAIFRPNIFTYSEAENMAFFEEFVRDLEQVIAGARSIVLNYVERAHRLPARYARTAFAHFIYKEYVFSVLGATFILELQHYADVSCIPLLDASDILERCRSDPTSFIRLVQIVRKKHILLPHPASVKRNGWQLCRTELTGLELVKYHLSLPRLERLCENSEAFGRIHRPKIMELFRMNEVGLRDDIQESPISERLQDSFWLDEMNGTDRPFRASSPTEHRRDDRPARRGQRSFRGKSHGGRYNPRFRK